MPAVREERIVLVRDPRAEGDLGVALAALEDVRARTKRAVAGLDDATLAARPAGAGNSIGMLVRHIALVELDWVLTDIGRGEPIPADAPAMLRLDDPMADPGPRLLAEFVEALDFARAVTVDRLGRLPASEIDAEREYRDERVHRVFNVRWILHHLVEHEAHHEGQIALMRAAGARRKTP